MKNEKKEDRKFDITESLCMDDEFQKWIKMADKVQEFSDKMEKTANNATQSAMAQPLNEADPLPTVPTARPVSTVPLRPGMTVPKTTPQVQPSSDEQQIARNLASLRQMKSDRNITNALSANPTLKPLFDLLQQIN